MTSEMPFVVPELETADVQLKGLPAKVQRDSFHQQLVHREDRIAGVARFAGAGTTPNLFDAVMRQTPVPDLASDEKTERLLVHSGLTGSSDREHTPNSPGSRPPTASTREASCAGKRSLAQSTIQCDYARLGARC
jgi:hypothetical protein